MGKAPAKVKMCRAACCRPSGATSCCAIERQTQALRGALAAMPELSSSLNGLAGEAA